MENEVIRRKKYRSCYKLQLGQKYYHLSALLRATISICDRIFSEPNITLPSNKVIDKSFSLFLSIKQCPYPRIYSQRHYNRIFVIMRISVEGNMGAGKSTFLKYFEEESKIKLPQLKLDFSQEPVSEWSSLGSGKEDLLKPGIYR